MIDSKTVLTGFYSDPPDLDFYTKQLGRNGQVMKSKYCLDLIECLRGTDHTEAYHKNLAVTFGSWHIGVGMLIACLLNAGIVIITDAQRGIVLVFPVLGNTTPG